MFFEIMPGIFQAALVGFKTKIIGGLCPVQSGVRRDQAQHFGKFPRSKDVSRKQLGSRFSVAIAGSSLGIIWQ
jgi:hypothetical protein